MTQSFVVAAVPPERLAEMRDGGIDDDGNVLGMPRVADGTEPVRCCLRMARSGEEIYLVSYRPFGNASGPYAEAGPVFVHARDCGGYSQIDVYPPEFQSRQQVYRCYDEAGCIVGGVVASGHEALDGEIASLFREAAVERIHVRNIVYGCYMFEIRRSPSAA